jgi:hypothetical protein
MMKLYYVAVAKFYEARRSTNSKIFKIFLDVGGVKIETNQI